MTFNEKAPAAVRKHQAGAHPKPQGGKSKRIEDMRHITRKPEPFNNLPLWCAAGARRFRELPYPAKRIARQIGCEPELANLIAELAGLTGRQS